MEYFDRSERCGSERSWEDSRAVQSASVWYSLGARQADLSVDFCTSLALVTVAHCDHAALKEVFASRWDAQVWKHHRLLVELRERPLERPRQRPWASYRGAIRRRLHIDVDGRRHGYICWHDCGVTVFHNICRWQRLCDRTVKCYARIP